MSGFSSDRRRWRARFHPRKCPALARSDAVTTPMIAARFVSSAIYQAFRRLGIRGAQCNRLERIFELARPAWINRKFYLKSSPLVLRGIITSTEHRKNFSIFGFGRHGCAPLGAGYQSGHPKWGATMDRITESMLNEFSGETGISALDESVRFEHFASYATVQRIHAETFDTSDIVLGNSEPGIDGIAIIVNGVLVPDSDTLESILDSHLPRLMLTLFSFRQTADGRSTLVRWEILSMQCGIFSKIPTNYHTPTA